MVDGHHHDMDTGTNTKERCRSCDQMFELMTVPGTKGGYIPEHQGNRKWFDDAGEQRICTGSKKRSKEFRDKNKAEKNHKHHRVLAHLKDDILIAYDAWESGRGGFDFDKLVDMAITEYGIRFGRTWTTAHPYFTQRCGGGDWKNYKKDVYCLFCRGLLWARITIAADPEALPKVKQHTTACALLCLAGRRDMKPPDHRGLIDEDRAFAE